jgi:acyl dehydratase
MAMLFFEDIVMGEEERFGAYPVGREEVIAFATQYDPQPFHLSEEAAGKSMFGSLAASGWHTAAISMRMMVDHGRANGRRMIAGLGVDALRWHKPVYPGDVLSCATTVIGLRESASNPEAGIVEIDMRVLNQNGDQVLSYRSASLIPKRKQGK